MIGFGDLDDGLAGARPAKPSSNDDIRKDAHIVNGGGAADTPCRRCAGTGKWRGTWKVLTCNGCNGTGRVTADRARGMDAAFKGKATKTRNFAGWMAENRETLDLFRAYPRANFLQKLLDDVGSGMVLTQNQIDAGLRVVAKFRASDAERATERDAYKKKVSGAVDVSRIEEMFQRAGSKPKGKRKDSSTRRPVLSTATVTIKPAKGKLGVLYVTSNDGDVYLGKIQGGQFQARSEATKDTLKQLRMICDDPEAAVRTYAEINGTYENGVLIEAPCGLCHRMMHDPESLARRVGPVCAANFGID